MTLLTVTSLTKSFGTQTVVDNLSFSIEEHTSTALIGPNGAGKTTTLSMLTGLLKQTSGSISMEGINDIRRVIGFLPQYPQFYSWLTALEYTEMTAKLSGVEVKKARMQSQKILEYVGLGAALHKKTATFSGGMKQRLGIAQALVHQPKLLLLDEPVSALDPVGRREIMNLLKEIQNETTILYSTHILNDAEEMTDQLLFLRGGKLVERGSLKEVRTRFDEPRIKIQFSSPSEALQFTSQSELPATTEGSVVFVDIVLDQPTMQQLLNHLANSPFTVEKVERVTASLEDIFMKVALDHESV
ncbi:ABC transporter ATP-binding protein [Lysinibacillus antri]|uniref:ABC transporter ATP-binding protein n=1 Tax=Lysinibacillus antri TaxID=2498145 RepID=A0A432L7J3_9BACI|nr:ABC transporter ATP-binding protein [Lysinibacillus antri]RUL47795.1 ABC transporter ATP-binding protein [Lysinibacillus antri]